MAMVTVSDFCKYRIEVAGEVEEEKLNGSSPLELKVERIEADSTWLSIDTDQSGFIGLLRHLHGLGFVFLSMDRECSIERNQSADVRPNNALPTSG